MPDRHWTKTTLRLRVTLAADCCFSFDVCYLPYTCFVSDSSAGAAVQLLLRAGALVAGHTAATPVAADVDVNDTSRDDKGLTDAVVVARQLKMYR